MMIMKRGAGGSQVNTMLRGFSGIPGLQEPSRAWERRHSVLQESVSIVVVTERRRVPSGMLPSAQAKERRPTTARWECRGWVQEICSEVAECLRWMRVTVMMW